MGICGLHVSMLPIGFAYWLIDEPSGTVHPRAAEHVLSALHSICGTTSQIISGFGSCYCEGQTT